MSVESPVFGVIWAHGVRSAFVATGVPVGEESARVRECGVGECGVGEWESGRVGEWASGRVGELNCRNCAALVTAYYLQSSRAFSDGH
jgi:hypothetical protein